MIYIVTNRHLIKNSTLLDVINKCSKEDIAGVILREKDLNDDELFNIGFNIKNILSKSNINLIINGNLNVAKKLNSYAYHTSFENFMKNSIEFDGKIGVSIHSTDEAVKSYEKGADYLIAGHIFQTDCKKDLNPRGLNFLKNVVDFVPIPVIAIGGINKNNISSVYKQGAYGVALMSSIMECDYLHSYMQSLKK